MDTPEQAPAPSEQPKPETPVVPAPEAPAPPAEAPKPDAAKAAEAPLSDLVRVAKAERKAAAAEKDAKAKAEALEAVAAKERSFNEKLSAGDLLGAARVYFTDEATVEKVFWALTDWAATRDQPKEPTVKEQVAAALAEQEAAAKKAAEDALKGRLTEAGEKLKGASLDEAEAADYAKALEECDTPEKVAELVKSAEHRKQQRNAYFAAARKELAAKHASFPTVAAKMLSGEVTQAEIMGHVEAMAKAILALNLPPAEEQQRIATELAPAAVLAALEQVLRGEAAPEQPKPEAPKSEAKPTTLSEITEQAIAEVERRARPSTVSSSTAFAGAAPIGAKKPTEMTLDELNEWSIAQAMKQRQGAAAAG
jgi:hypothetical protein